MRETFFYQRQPKSRGFQFFIALVTSVSLHVFLFALFPSKPPKTSVTPLTLEIKLTHAVATATPSLQKATEQGDGSKTIVPSNPNAGNTSSAEPDSDRGNGTPPRFSIDPDFSLVETFFPQLLVGEVTLTISIDSTGRLIKVETISLDKSIPDAAVSQLKRAITESFFFPAVKNGRPVDGTFEITVGGLAPSNHDAH